MSKLHFQPINGQAREILTAILKSPEVASCNQEEIQVLRLACEEIVMNVASYAYPEGMEGYLDVNIQKVASDTGHTENRIVIRFEDGGVAFNPLEQEKPDTGLSWDKRRIGGLGIFLFRRKMDDVRYAYVDNKNVLTIEKKI